MMRLSPDYLHCSKDAVSRGAQTFGRAVLKCFDLDEHAHRLKVDTRSKAQTALTGFASALTDDIAGFAILHQISASICSLLITRWRGNTELWQSVHYLDRPLSAFAPFFIPPNPTAPALRPTFCVWELAIVAHETQAWQRYLFSNRSAADLATWQSDCRLGPV